jgi:hypothetical protein
MKTITVVKGGKLPVPPRGFHYVELDDDGGGKGDRIFSLERKPNSKDILVQSLVSCIREASYDGRSPSKQQVGAFIDKLEKYIVKRLAKR